MISLFGIVLCSIYLINQCSFTTGHVIFINNDRSEIHYKPYIIVHDQTRKRRNDQTEENHLDKVVNHRCDEDSYTTLYSCSHVNECTAFSSCLNSIHCPATKQSYGSLTVNLLHLLGSDHCNTAHENSSCPHEKRLIILYNILAYWTDQRLNSNTNLNDDHSSPYCKNIPDFVDEVERRINEHCPFYASQVEAFLENYLCQSIKNDEFKSRELQTSSSSLDYLDEDKDLNFIHANNDLTNNTEQTVYVNDHQYYNVSYIIPKSGDIPINFIPDYKNQFTRIHALANRHQSAFTINLKFEFPFYGHTINRILVGTGGFIYTGDSLHSSLIGSIQYIAPFMANFDVSIGGNQSNIKYFDNSTHFVCTWNQLYLQDQQEAGPFTFQAILQSNGNIYFNYLRIPNVNISTANHAHRIGLSDAYMSEHNSLEQSIRVITLYDKLNLSRDRIRSGVSVIFTMDNTCNTFTDCSSCLANRGKRYNCSWCDDIRKCSDGYDRSRQQWVRAQCHRLASENICPRSFDDGLSLDDVPGLGSRNSYLTNDEQQNLSETSIVSKFRPIVITLVFVVLILFVVSLLATYPYAYRNPTTPVGMWLIEHRPSQCFARFRRFIDRNHSST